MRIGVIATDNATGVGRVYRRTVEALHRLAPEHDFRILVPAGSEGRHADLALAMDAFKAPRFPLLGRRLRDRNVRGLASRLGVSILHDMANGGLPLGPVPAVKIQTLHDTVPWIHPEVVPAAVRRWYRYMIPRVLADADLIVTVGATVKRDIVGRLGIPEGKVHVVENGVDDRFRPMGDKAEARKRVGLEFPYLLFVGNILPKRNVHRLVEAFARVAPRQPDLRLVLAGPYDGRDPYVIELQRLIDRLNLREKVLLPGYVKDEDLPALYNGAEAFAYIPFYEGFCLPPMEAGGCGVPVVVSDNPPLHDVVADGGLYVNAYDVEDIARGLETALFDPAARGELIERGRARAAHLTWDRTAKGILAVYERATARSA